MTQSESQERLKGMAIVGVGVLLISFDGLLIRLAQTNSWNVVFWRGLFTFISLGLVLTVSRGGRWLNTFRHGGWPAFVSAFLFGTGGAFFVTSVMFTKVANTVVIISSAPLFAALFTWMFRIDSVPLRTWLAIVTALCGVGIVFFGSLGGGGLLGDAIAVLAACNAGGNLTLLRHNAVLERMPLVCVGGLVMAAMAWPLAEPLSLGGQSYVVLGIMGLVQMPAALFLIAQSTRYLPSPEVSLFLLVETLLSTIWVWVFLGEDPPGLTLVGGVVIVTTLIFHSWLSLREMNRLQHLRA
jgi:drug/metabolite transporter (DMT)-like permease